MSGFVNRVDKFSDEGEEKMKKLITLCLLLVLAVGCNKEEAAPAEEAQAVEEVTE